MKHIRHRRTPCVLLGLLCLVAACDGNGNPVAPSSPRVLQGTITMPAAMVFVRTFQVDRAGTLSTSNDVDSAVLARECTLAQVTEEATGCGEVDALFIDASVTAKPSVLSGPVQPGAHTFVILNFGPASEEVSYQITLP